MGQRGHPQVPNPAPYWPRIKLLEYKFYREFKEFFIEILVGLKFLFKSFRGQFPPDPHSSLEYHILCTVY